MPGWIKLFRDIVEHWVFNNELYLKAWITIIIEANHKNKKVLIEGELINCDRGQSVKSTKTWSKLFGKKWSIQKVRTFFKLLEDDNMVKVEGLRKTTRLTVCNYEKYQDEQLTDNAQITHSQRTDNAQITTNKNDKNDKNDNNIYNDEFERFWNAYEKKGNRQKAFRKFKELTKAEKEEMISKVDIYIKSTPDKKYRKNAETYLNKKNKHWNDEIINNNTLVNYWEKIPPMNDLFWKVKIRDDCGLEFKGFELVTNNMRSEQYVYKKILAVLEEHPERKERLDKARVERNG